jgi:ribosomal protein S18 acetylase RimI-like enzyme
VTAYRFCRTDDVPLLVRAYNHCYAEPEGALPITVEDLRRWRRELDVWCSSCMIALEGDETIGVLIGAKRAHASFIHTVAVRPEHRRRGHARHMLASLARKMAILEPRLLLAEVPQENEAATELLEACGYRAGETLVDFLAAPLAGVSPGSPLQERLPRPTAVSWAQLEQSGVLGLGGLDEQRTWLRSAAALRTVRDELHGLALVSDLRIEAWLLWRDRASGEREVVAVATAVESAPLPLVKALLLECRRATERALSMPRVHSRERLGPSLLDAGFHTGGEHVAYSAEAAPG